MIFPDQDPVQRIIYSINMNKTGDFVGTDANMKDG